MRSRSENEGVVKITKSGRTPGGREYTVRRTKKGQTHSTVTEVVQKGKHKRVFEKVTTRTRDGRLSTTKALKRGFSRKPLAKGPTKPHKPKE